MWEGAGKLSVGVPMLSATTAEGVNPVIHAETKGQAAQGRTPTPLDA